MYKTRQWFWATPPRKAKDAIVSNDPERKLQAENENQPRLGVVFRAIGTPGQQANRNEEDSAMLVTCLLLNAASMAHGTQQEGVTKPAKNLKSVAGERFQDKNISLCDVAISSDAGLRWLEHLGADCRLVHSTSVSGCKPASPS